MVKFTEVRLHSIERHRGALMITLRWADFDESRLPPRQMDTSVRTPTSEVDIARRYLSDRPEPFQHDGPNRSNQDAAQRTARLDYFQVAKLEGASIEDFRAALGKLVYLDGAQPSDTERQHCRDRRARPEGRPGADCDARSAH